MERAACEAQGGVWNQEGFPAVRELKNCSSRREGNRGRRKGIQKIGRMVAFSPFPALLSKTKTPVGRIFHPQRLALFVYDMQIGILKQIKNTEAKTEERNGSPTSAASANVGESKRLAAVLPARHRSSRCPCHRPNGRRGGGSPSGSARSSTSGNRLRVRSSCDSLEGSRSSSNPTNSTFTQSTMRCISGEPPKSASRCAIHPRNWSACRSIRASLRSNSVRSVSRVCRAAASPRRRASSATSLGIRLIWFMISTFISAQDLNRGQAGTAGYPFLAFKFAPTADRPATVRSAVHR
jgi:hypothetical protein